MNLIIATFAFIFSLFAYADTLDVIHGKEASTSEYPEVLKVHSGLGIGTATLVGPRVFTTAAHNAEHGSTMWFEVNQKRYVATIFRSEIYPKEDHDVAVGIWTEPISFIRPAIVGGSVTEGEVVTLLGYGCTGHDGGEAGILRIGSATVTGFLNFDFLVTAKAGQSALCAGDSGGPGFLIKGGRRYLVGINSKGDYQVTSYLTRTDLPATQNFLQASALNHKVEICGINANCL